MTALLNRNLLLLGFLFFSTFLSAKQWCKTYSYDPYIGPEIYYVTRNKEGGAKQSGTLFGVRLGYDHIKRYKFYWGVEGLWAQGTLSGKNDQKDKLRSEMTDLNIESRFGYTFQSKCWRCASFTPFFGVGYFEEKNFYRHPTPLQIHFTNTFRYIPFGFLSQVFITPNWSAGLNLKVRYLFDGEQKSSNDEKFGKLTQCYEEKFQYRVELPVNYFFCWRSIRLEASIVPFYEFRHYGHRANFPFDFLETKLNLYGATLKFHTIF